MEYLKLLGKSLLYILAITLGLTLLITLFNYVNLFNAKVTTFFKMITPIIAMFVGGFIVGKKAKAKGWLEGLKLGLIMIVLLILMSFLIFKQDWELKNVIFYLILLSSTIFGSMVGISKRIENISN